MRVLYHTYISLLEFLRKWITRLSWVGGAFLSLFLILWLVIYNYIYILWCLFLSSPPSVELGLFFCGYF